jgi:hypothetical protein
MNGRSVLALLALAFVAILVQQRGPLMRYVKIERM